MILIPNIALCVTEGMGAWSSMANILLPLGFYMAIISAFKRTGWAIIAMLPFMILAAFQLVLLFLYGGSIIAVDMFLNVVTTNMSEATELLRNLRVAIVLVVILYLPVIIWAIVTIARHKELSWSIRRRILAAGALLMILGGVSAVISTRQSEDYDAKDDIFPANVIYNIKVAADRTVAATHYDDTSANFKYNATSCHPDSLPEVYIMVIGETSRAINWQLNGYNRDTNPRLSRRDNLISFSHALSESNTTHKSVPMLLSCLTGADFASIGSVKSIIEAFNDAGYETSFISNQAPNHSYTEFFGREARNVVYLTDTLGRHRYDGEMLPYVAGALALHPDRKQFIVLHSYGSHFKYQERYPAECCYYTPDACNDVDKNSLPELINAYDNSIRYTDQWLDSLVQMLEDSGRPAAMLYASDHGEDILDDERGRFLHASPTPTYYQLHVAMLSWVSDRYNQLYPAVNETMKQHSDNLVSSTSSLYNTMLDIAGIKTPYSDMTLSVASPLFTHRAPLYVNDKNEGIPLYRSGLKRQDIGRLHSLGY